MVLFGWLVESRAADYLLSGAAAAALALLLGLYTYQARLIYIPQFPPGSRSLVWRPSRFGFAVFDEVTLVASDGVRTHAFWIPSQAPAHPPSTVPTILFLHANAGNMGHRLPILQRIAELLPANFLIISYRGYGESEGSPEEGGMRRDAQAALDYLLGARAKQIDAARVVVYGQSIGGAVAIDLTARNQSKIAGLIVENTFLSLPKLIPHVIPWLGWAAPLCHQRWDSESRLREMLAGTLPRILFLSGGHDELIPPAHMRSLFAIAAGTEEGRTKARLEIFEKGTHNDTCLQPGYFAAISAFLASL